MSVINRKWFAAVRVSDGAVIDLGLLQGDLLFAHVDRAWLNGLDDQPTAITDAAWDNFSTPDAVRVSAQQKIDRANEVLRADSPLHAIIELTGIVWERDAAVLPGFRRHFALTLESGVLVLSGSSVHLTINGYESAPSRTVGLRQKELAEKDLNFQTAVTLFEAAGDDIRKLFVVWEYIRDESPLKSPSLAGEPDTKAFVTTANNAANIRHIGGQNQVTRLVDGTEARDIIRRLLDRWLQGENPT